MTPEEVRRTQEGFWRSWSDDNRVKETNLILKKDVKLKKRKKRDRENCRRR